MSGYEVARRMKQDPVMKDIPLVAVTALAMVGDQDRVLSAGFDGYIAKPIAPELFVDQVENFLEADQRSRASPKLHATSSSLPNDSFASRQATIVVVDDVAVNASLAKIILEPFGYRVKTAASVHEGLLVCQQMHPDLIITDIHLKDGTGYDLLRRIKAESSLHLVPVLFVSGSAAPSDQLHALEGGALKLLVRPVEPELLLSEVAAALRGAERNVRGNDTCS
jgi:two-component system cell cycle response regulator